MKNLINRVLVVLTVSALFAGSIDASQQKRGRKAPTTKRMPAKRMAPRKIAMTPARALAMLRSKSSSSFARYPEEERKANAQTLRDEVPNAKDQIAMLERESLIKDDAKRATSFATGAGMKAAAAIQLAMLGGDLKDAVADLKENPTPTNVAKVAQLQTEATASVAQLDDQVEGYKGYMTQRNIIMGTIAIATVAVTGYCIANGAPTILAQYVPQVVTDVANKIYTATSKAGAYLGLQEGGTIHGYAKSAKETVSGYVTPVSNKFYDWGSSAANAVGATAAKNALMNRIYGAEQKVEKAEAELNKLEEEAANQ